MPEVRVVIHERNRRVGAMIKALSVEVAGYQSVKGATKEFLKRYGYYVFRFPSLEKANEFKKTVEKYIPESLALVQE